jgi:hypothetical protein
LDCGSYHEKGTICGKCYSKVKTETEEIQDQLFKDDNFKYNYPVSEVSSSFGSYFFEFKSLIFCFKRSQFCTKVKKIIKKNWEKKKEFLLKCQKNDQIGSIMIF